MNLPNIHRVLIREVHLHHNVKICDFLPFMCLIKSKKKRGIHYVFKVRRYVKENGTLSITFHIGGFFDV